MPVNLQKKWLTIAVNHLKIITKQILLLIYVNQLIISKLVGFYRCVLFERSFCKVTKNLPNPDIFT